MVAEVVLASEAGGPPGTSFVVAGELFGLRGVRPLLMAVQVGRPAEGLTVAARGEAREDLFLTGQKSALRTRDGSGGSLSFLPRLVDTAFAGLGVRIALRLVCIERAIGLADGRGGRLRLAVSLEIGQYLQTPGFL